MPRRSVEQTTPLDISVKFCADISEWFRGLSRLGGALYERAPEEWRRFEEFRREFERRILFLQYEGAIPEDDPADKALGRARSSEAFGA